jgi:hypothetical protein
MQALETMAKWDFGTWIVFLYMATGVIFMILWCIRITQKTNDLEEQIFLMYAAALWSAFWPICLLKELIFGSD